MRDLNSFTITDVRAATTPEQLHVASLALLLQDLVKAYPWLAGSGVLICLESFPDMVKWFQTLAPGVHSATECFRYMPDFRSVGVVRAFAPIPFYVALNCRDYAFKNAWLDLAAWTEENALQVARDLGGIIERRISYAPSAGGFSGAMGAAGEGQTGIPGIRKTRGNRRRP